MTDRDQTIMPSLNGGTSLPEPPGVYDDFPTLEDGSANFASGLVSLGFIKAAIRRSAWFWCVTAVVGFLLGFGVYVTSPHSYQASTSLLLTYGPYENINTAAADNQAIAQSRAVAGLAVRKLGLQQSASSFLTTYTVTVSTNRVLLFTASALSSNQAVLRANTVATAFLQFRAEELQTEQNLVFKALDQQINQTRQHIKSITAQISQLSTQPSSPAQQSQLISLQTERSQAATTLTDLEQTMSGDQANTQTATTAAVKGSVVLDTAVPLPHSRLKPMVLYAAIGLFVGLVLGIGIVVMRALLSDRLRQRDDVAHALGAPVKLSVGTVRRNRDANVQRIAAYLGRAVPENSRGISALAVVPVDDLQVPALSLVSLAVSFAEEGKHVVVADLCSGAPAARLLGAKEPGVRAVSAHDARLIVAVPERDDVVPIGPLGRGSTRAQRSSFTEAVVAACGPGDLLLTLVTLDPSLDGEHLSTWATDAVAVITAGRSSWTKINAVGEMVRLSGTRLVSAVLVGADNTDESLGVVDTPQARRDADVIEHRSHPDANDFMVPVEEGRGRHHQMNGDPRRRE